MATTYYKLNPRLPWPPTDPELRKTWSIAESLLKRRQGVTKTTLVQICKEAGKPEHLNELIDKLHIVQAKKV